MINKRILIPGVVCALFVISTSPVYAYLDPGTGSYIMQVVVAAFLAGGYAVKVFWTRIKSFFTNIFKSKDISQ